MWWRSYTTINRMRKKCATETPLVKDAASPVAAMTVTGLPQDVGDALVRRGEAGRSIQRYEGLYGR